MRDFILGDCLEAMRKMPDKFADLAIVDPPYFSGPEIRGYYGKKTSSIDVKRIDYPIILEWKVPGSEYFNELFRVSKNQIIWGCNYYNYQFGPGRIVWDKCNADSSFSDCEIAYCSLHDSVRLFRYMWNGMLQGKSITEGHIMQGNKKLNQKRIHPTEKPIALYQWTLSKYAKPGQILLDTHTGSGSSLVAFEEMGFDYVAYEINPTHYKRASLRREQYRSQLKLFA